MRRLIFGAAFLVVFTAGTAAGQSVQTGSKDDQARAHFRLGRAHYDNGQFLEAAAEFEAAHRISGRAALLYNVYLSYRDANDTPRAASSLRQYLTQSKEVENRPQLEAKLKALEAGLAEGAAAGPQPTAPPVAAAPPPAAAQPAAAPQPGPTAAAPPEAMEPPEEPPSGSTNLAPWILMGTGGAMVVGSIITGIMTSSAQSDAESECPSRMGCKPSVQDTIDKGETLALVTDILLFGGIAVAGTGAILFVVDQGSSDSDTPTASIACVPGACQGTLRGTF